MPPPTTATVKSLEYGTSLAAIIKGLPGCGERKMEKRESPDAADSVLLLGAIYALYKDNSILSASRAQTLVASQKK